MDNNMKETIERLKAEMSALPFGDRYFILKGKVQELEQQLDQQP